MGSLEDAAVPEVLHLKDIPDALHIVSPLLYSSFLSRRCGHHVYLKLDNTQPSGSFKTRGVSAQVIAEYRKHGEGTELVCSSGGNAGLACAYSARVLGLKCTVFVPTSTSSVMVRRLRELDAEVVQGGAAWDDADKAARKGVASNPKAAYIHPFQGEALIQGHSSLISEIQHQLQSAGIPKPDALVCSVGGGGLLAGILQGMNANGWENVPVIAAETTGANCLNQSLHASYAQSPPQPTTVTLPGITSIATSLGARTPSLEVVEACMRHPGGVVSMVASDRRAVEAVVEFANDHQILVEPACGVALVPFYDTTIIPRAMPVGGRKNIVVIVCGGSAVSLDKVATWMEDLPGESKEVEIEQFGGPRRLSVV